MTETKIKGTTAFVTGANRGIGRAITEALLERGADKVYAAAETAGNVSILANNAGVAPDSVEARKISFNPGHRQKFWHRNCVAVGMSAGFLEPLEASALVLIELAGRMIAEELPATRALMDIVAKRYNEKFLYRWDRIIDFLKLHYVLSRRSDTLYWNNNQKPETIPDSLHDNIELWRHHVPWHNDFSQRDEIFSSASYQYVLYGMGFETQVRAGSRQLRSSDRARSLFEENSKATDRLLRNLPKNRDLLRYIDQSGLPKTG